MFITMVLAALVVELVFSALGLIPSERPATQDVFGSIELDYKAALNALGLVVFAVLFALTMRRGATDPVCGMSVDRGTAPCLEHDGRTFYFCSGHCKGRFEREPERYVRTKQTATS